MISLAAKEPVEQKPNGLCDAPSTEISFLGAHGKREVLFSSGGCGSPRLQRVGAKSNQLVAMIDMYCPHTNDYGGDR